MTDYASIEILKLSYSAPYFLSDSGLATPISLLSQERAATLMIRKNATGYVQEVLRVTEGLDCLDCLDWSDHVKSGINTAFHHFESSLQQTLDPPSELNSFIDKVQICQEGWFEINAGYGKPRPPDPPNSYSRPQPSTPQQSYQPRLQQPYQSYTLLEFMLFLNRW